MPLRLRSRYRLEYAAKGWFLGLQFLAVVRAPDWKAASLPGALALAGAFLAMAFSERKTAGGPRLARWALGLLGGPLKIYAATLAGQLAGVLWFERDPIWLATCAGGGMAIGLLLERALDRRERPQRLVRELALLLVVAGVIGALFARGTTPTPTPGLAVALALMGGAAAWFLLLLAGDTEESELELAVVAIAAALAAIQAPMAPLVRGVTFLLPVGLFVVYCERIRRGMIAFKHALRGLSGEQRGDLREALVGYRRALAIDPKLAWAQTGNWRVHKRIDVRQLQEDPDLRDMIDPVACLERARKILDRDAPSGEALVEAHGLVELAAARRPDLRWSVARERLRTLLAAKQDVDAATYLLRILPLDPGETDSLPDHEAEALFRVWGLALADGRIFDKAGTPLLAERAGLFSAIAAVERRRRQWQDDPEANGLRPALYGRLKASDAPSLGPDPAQFPWFSFAYCRDLGLAAANGTPPDYEHAATLLRIAAAGLPGEQFVIWQVLAKIEETRGNRNASRAWREAIKAAGKALGPNRLERNDRAAFDESVRVMAENDRASGNVVAAIENYLLFAESAKSGADTRAILRELMEQNGDLLGAIRQVESALAFELPERARQSWKAEKARLYGLLDPEAMKRRRDKPGRWFDFDFCFRSAEKAFDERSDGFDRWLALAQLGGAEMLPATEFLAAKADLSEGKLREAADHLERVRAAKPERFPTADREKLHYDACRIVADLYLDDLGEPKKAAEILRLLERHRGSGAETLFKLGRAYEAAGERAQARKWYDMVSVYSDHPRAAEARAAAERMKSES